MRVKIFGFKLVSQIEMHVPVRYDFKLVGLLVKSKVVTLI